MRLTASEGRVLLGETPLEALEDTAALPDEVAHALQQWAWVAGMLNPLDSADPDAVAVSRRGAQLAVLVAAVRAGPVEYVDPVSGAVCRVVPYPEAEPAAGEPTPWATGLAVTGFVAAVTAALVLILTAVLRAEYRWLWVPANALVGIGLAPTIWLLRAVPFWRWISYGITAGLILAWLGLLI
ncbi:MAG TPA: DUF2537 domain-containing protein [Pseudonocardia sp.]